jgi:hypothetical protein
MKFPSSLLFLSSLVSSNAFAFQVGSRTRVNVIMTTRGSTISETTSSALNAMDHGSENVRPKQLISDAFESNIEKGQQQQSRRSVLSNALLATAAFNALSLSTPSTANAAVGKLPEYSASKSVLQGITIDVTDLTQQDEMIAFLDSGFGMKKLNQRTVGSVTDTWMAFGPEQMSIPDEWEPAVSSFGKYGGHASVRIRYDSSQSSDAPYYIKGNDAPAPGDNIAYLQMGVTGYRVSQMVKNGGNVFNGYGIVEVISPSGLPIRGVVGISPDPMMFVALNCQNVKESKAFYEQLGFVQQEYPYCRPNQGKGQFEPPQPKKSVYMAPSKNCMGVLLLQAKKSKNTKPNPALRSLNIVYQASEGTTVDTSSGLLRVVDPNSVPIVFEPFDLFEKIESSSRIALPIDE